MNDGTIYTDLIRCFPTRSYRNMQYIFVAYAYQPNAIILEPMKSRESTSRVEAFQSVYEYSKNVDTNQDSMVWTMSVLKQLKTICRKRKLGSNLSNQTITVSNTTQ